MGIMLQYVLVVDCSKLVRKIIVDNLEDFGYKVVGEAANGEEAISKYNLLKPDLVIMNLVMPQMNAFEVIQKIVDLDNEAKIIICSSCQEKKEIYQAIKAGAKDFLLKPFNVDYFNQVVEKLN